MKTRQTYLLYSITVFLLCGCGTLRNTFPDISGKGPSPALKVYGGVRSDAHSVIEMLAWEEDESMLREITQVVFVPLVLLDIPFSAIGDTLTLDQTIPASRQRRSNEKWAEDLPEIEDYPVIEDDDDD